MKNHYKSALAAFLRASISFFILLVSYGCSDGSSNNTSNLPDAAELQARIDRIENNLQPIFQIAGESPTYSIEERMRELGIPGLSVAVVSNGKIDWAKGYGLADVAENRPVHPDTLFLAGSISKPVSALRTLQLAELGMVSLDHNVNDYLTSWQLPDNEFTQNEKVTLRRIMNHTAGLTVWGFPGYHEGDVIPSVTEVLDGEGNTAPVRVYKTPGESWQYSGGGYTIMQLLISDTGDREFPAIMKENVLDPLEMSGSTFENPLPELYRAVAATGYRLNGDEVEGKWPIHPEMAAAGLWTTPSELIQYAIDVQNISQNNSDGILQYSSVEEMLTPGMNDQGLGPVVGEYTFGHTGATEGFRAALTAWKELPAAIVIMLNSEHYEIIPELQLAIAAEYGLPGFAPTIETVIDLPAEQLSKYAGTYESPGLSQPVNIYVSDGVLEVTSVLSRESIILLPKSETLFIDRNNGIPWEFEIEDDYVTGIVINNQLEVTRSG